MKKLLFACATATLAFSCSNNQKSSDKTAETKTSTTGERKVENPENTNNATTTPLIDKYTKIIGSFVGQFGDNKMTMLITNFKGDSIFGRSIVAMNDRPFKGIVNYGNGAYTINAAEPGDNKYDGKFSFSLNENNLNAVSGKWEANDKSITPKTFNFVKKAFAYKKDVGQFPEASQRLLTEEDVAELPKEQLAIMRNNIFARHGYVFYKKATRDYYEKEDWYVPNALDVKTVLTDLEVKNITLIKRFEKYAEEYGDDFGR